MSYSLKLLPEAQQDIVKIKDWYHQRQPKESSHFEHQLSESIDYLSSNPKLFEEVYKDIRQVTISRSPFNIFYLVDEAKNYIIILAVIRSPTLE